MFSLIRPAKVEGHGVSAGHIHHSQGGKLLQLLREGRVSRITQAREAEEETVIGEEVQKTPRRDETRLRGRNYARCPFDSLFWAEVRRLFYSVCLRWQNFRKIIQYVANHKFNSRNVPERFFQSRFSTLELQWFLLLRVSSLLLVSSATQLEGSTSHCVNFILFFGVKISSYLTWWRRRR